MRNAASKSASEPAASGTMHILQLSGAIPRLNGDGSSSTFATMVATCKNGVEVKYAFFDPVAAKASAAFTEAVIKQCEGRGSFEAILPTRTFYDCCNSVVDLIRASSRVVSAGVARELTRVLDVTAPIHRLIPMIRRLPSQHRRSLQVVVNLHNFDLIQVDYPWMIAAVDSLPRNVPKVFVAHEIQSAIIRQLCPNNSPLLRAIATTERVAMMKYDAVLTLCEEDADYLVQHYELNNVHCSPLATETNGEQNINVESAPEPLVFSFLGGYSHAPNAEAMLWLRDELGPAIIRQFDQCTFRIVGAVPEDFASTFDEHFDFRGFVEDPYQELQRTIFLCPIRVGSGMRIKILSAISAGVPVISTTVGARGLGLRDGKSCLLADTAEEFVEKISALKSQPELVTSLTRNAKAHLEQRFSAEAVGAQRTQVYREIIERFCKTKGTLKRTRK